MVTVAVPRLDALVKTYVNSWPSNCEPDLGARSSGVADGVLESLLEGIVPLPSAEQEDGRVEIVVGSGLGGQDRLYGSVAAARQTGSRRAT